MTSAPTDAASASWPAPVSYVLPIRRASAADDGLGAYLGWLAQVCDVVVVDGSAPEVVAAHRAAWPLSVRHVPPDPDLASRMGKVDGVLTGVRHARHDRVVIADDDVRYDGPALHRMAMLLDEAAAVRPQNYFAPLPWHACWDTARTLLNRCLDGDWPGTLGVRRSVLLAAGGYDGDVMFENLELVRTIEAAGGLAVAPLDLYVRRLPPTVRHFAGQRVRQAYDEFARPVRMGAFLALGPAGAWMAARRRWRWVAACAAGAVGLAEVGRRRAGGAAVFPASASFCAPLWLAERGLCAWLAVVSHLRLGGVRYGAGVVPRAATPRRELRRRLADLPPGPPWHDVHGGAGPLSSPGGQP